LAASGGGTASVYGINIVGTVTGGLSLNSSTGSGGLGDANNVNAGVGTLSGTATIATSNGATGMGHTGTITTTAPHGFVPGQQVVISGVGVAGYNGTFTIGTVPTPTTFTYTDANTNLTASGGGTAAVGFVFSASGGAALFATFESALSGVTLN